MPKFFFDLRNDLDVEVEERGILPDIDVVAAYASRATSIEEQADSER